MLFFKKKVEEPKTGLKTFTLKFFIKGLKYEFEYEEEILACRDPFGKKSIGLFDDQIYSLNKYIRDFGSRFDGYSNVTNGLKDGDGTVVFDAIYYEGEHYHFEWDNDNAPENWEENFYEFYNYMGRRIKIGKYPKKIDYQV